MMQWTSQPDQGICLLLSPWWINARAMKSFPIMIWCQETFKAKEKMNLYVTCLPNTSDNSWNLTFAMGTSTFIHGWSPTYVESASPLMEFSPWDGSYGPRVRVYIHGCGPRPWKMPSHPWMGILLGSRATDVFLASSSHTGGDISDSFNFTGLLPVSAVSCSLACCPCAITQSYLSQWAGYLYKCRDSIHINFEFETLASRSIIEFYADKELWANFLLSIALCQTTE